MTQTRIVFTIGGKKFHLFTIPQHKKKFFLMCFIGLLILFVIIIASYLQYQQKQIPTSVLAPHIEMGPLVLKVNNLSDMQMFYTKDLGLQKISSDKTTIALGYKGKKVITFINTPRLSMPSSSDPGLDQIAIVYATKAGLAKTLKKIMQTDPTLYQGGTDRVIDQSFYVVDPQGNSIELYYDTDPSTWPRRNGKVQMQQLPIDINQFIAQNAIQAGDESMKIGHLQIRVGDIVKAKDFYVNTIGFYPESQSIIGDSLFLSDGFYHHNLGINQVFGYDSDPITKYLGIQGFTITLPDVTYVNKLKNRFTAANYPYHATNNNVTFLDPWGIQITITSPPAHWWDIVTRL